MHFTDFAVMNESGKKQASHKLLSLEDSVGEVITIQVEKYGDSKSRRMFLVEQAFHCSGIKDLETLF